MNMQNNVNKILNQFSCLFEDNVFIFRNMVSLVQRYHVLMDQVKEEKDSLKMLTSSEKLVKQLDLIFL